MMTALLAFAVATSAPEQPAPQGDTTISRTAQSDAIDRNAATLDSYFYCIVHEDKQSARELVGLPYGSAGFVAAQKRLGIMQGLCMSAVNVDKATFSHFLNRGGLARSLYIAAYPGTLPKFDPVIEAANGVSAPGSTSALLDGFAACVVTAEPVAADAFVRAEPGTSKSSTNLSAMSKSFPDCLTAVPKLSLDRQMLRAALAFALYQRTDDYKLAVQ